MDKFLLYTTVGSAIWNSILLIVGNKVGKNWESILSIMNQYSHIVFMLLIILFIVFLVYFFGFRTKERKAKKN